MRGRSRSLALFALALGGFGIGCSEFVSMGLLPGIARTLLPGVMAQSPETGIAQAGWAISAYAAGVVIGAPLVALLAVRMDRARLIVLLAIALAAGTVLSAAMPTFGLTVLARFLAGLPHGAYFGVASLIAADLMGPGSQGKGIALALSGLTVANLVGVPLLTAFGQGLGWRTSYLLIAAIFAVTVILLLVAVPRTGPPPPRTARQELSMFRSKQVWALCVIAAVGFAGFFCVFSYVADLTEQVAGMPARLVPVVLAVAGLGMTLGNVLGGWATDRSERRTLYAGFPVLILSLVALLLLAHSPAGLLVTIFLVTGANSIIMPTMQAWLIRVSGDSQVLGAALNHAAFNLANSLGAALGGWVIAAGLGYLAPTAVAVGLSVLGFAMVLAVIAGQGALTRRRLRASGRSATARPRADGAAGAAGHDGAR